jgi:hypothetical protein
MRHYNCTEDFSLHRQCLIKSGHSAQKIRELQLFTTVVQQLNQGTDTKSWRFSCPSGLAGISGDFFPARLGHAGGGYFFFAKKVTETKREAESLHFLKMLYCKHIKQQLFKRSEQLW